MEGLCREIETQWRALIDDPLGPRHYCRSRIDDSIVPPTVHRASLHCALLRLAYNNSILEMYVHQEQSVINHSLDRQGDLLVGVILRAPVIEATISLEIGAQRICDLDLYRDEPRLMLGGNNFLPLLPLQYQMIRLKSTTPVTLDLIYAFIENDELRSELVNRSWSVKFATDSYLHLDSGSGCTEVNPRFTFTVIHSLPISSWVQEMKRQHARTKCFEEELVAAAWHPSRFQDWCLDISE